MLFTNKFHNGTSCCCFITMFILFIFLLNFGTVNSDQLRCEDDIYFNIKTYIDSFRRYNSYCLTKYNIQHTRQSRLILDGKKLLTIHELSPYNYNQYVKSVHVHNSEELLVTDFSSFTQLEELSFFNSSVSHAILNRIYSLRSLVKLDLSYNNINVIEESIMGLHNYPGVENDLNKNINLINLNLSHNSLENLLGNTFLKVPYLNILDLSYNSISNLNYLSFEGLTKLQILNLTHNNIDKLHLSLLKLTNLKELYLKENFLKVVESNDFLISTLEKIIISYNLINTLGLDCFKVCVNLTYLDLSNNRIEAMNSETLNKNKILNYIDLTNNYLTTIDKYSFKENNQLLTLKLLGNKIEGVLQKEMFEGLGNVETLNLTQQSITSIDNYTFRGIPYLNYLNISFNNLTNIAQYGFNKLSRLTTLDLSNNILKEINFDKSDLVNLKWLSISNNVIEIIMKGVFKYMSELEYLDLSFNKIKHIEPGSYDTMSKVIMLQLGNNPFQGSVDQYTFSGLHIVSKLEITQHALTSLKNNSFNDMNNLQVLNLSHGEISDIQYDVFNGAANIKMIDLSFNNLTSFSINTTNISLLKSLILSNNFITLIHTYVMKPLKNLERLVVSQNELTHFDNDIFEYNQQIYSLDLSSNKDLDVNETVIISLFRLSELDLSRTKARINFENFKNSSVNVLTVRHNNITDLKVYHLHNQKFLRNVDFSSNSILAIEKGTFAELINLLKLYLNSNNISYIQPGSFMDNRDLLFLNLSHNQITTISFGAFKGLINLKVLDLSFNHLYEIQTAPIIDAPGLSNYFLDYNYISSLNPLTQFHQPGLVLSIGHNILSCDTVHKFKLHPYYVTLSTRYPEHHSDNVEDISCIGQNVSQQTDIFISDSSEYKNLSVTLISIRDLLRSIVSHSYKDSVVRNSSDIVNAYNDVIKSVKSLIKTEREAMDKDNKLKDDLINHNSILLKILSNLQSNVLNTSVSLNESINNIKPKSTSFTEDPNDKFQNIENMFNHFIAKEKDRIVADLKKDILQKLFADNANIIEKVTENIINKNDIKQDVSSTVEPKYIKENTERLTADSKNIKQNNDNNIDNSKSTSTFLEVCVAILLLIALCFFAFKIYKSGVLNTSLNRPRSLSTNPMSESVEM